jgi:hypothetical protein
MPKKTATVKCYRNEKAPFDAIYVYKVSGQLSHRLQSPNIEKIAETYAHDWVFMNMKTRKNAKHNYSANQAELDCKAKMKKRLLGIFAMRGWK